MRLRQAGLIAVALLALSLTPFESAVAATTGQHKPSPSWTLQPQTKTAVPDTALTGGCHGHSDTPWSASDRGVAGISYGASQTCVGTFVLQRVCVELQERDYYSNFDAVTGLNCGSWTANSYTYYGRWVSCAAGHGVYRTWAEGVVEPTSGLPQTATGASYSATLC